MQQLPETGFVRVSQIVGNKKSNPPINGFIPGGKSTWWAGVKNGRFPSPVRMGSRCTMWRIEDIREVIAKLGAQQ